MKWVIIILFFIGISLTCKKQHFITKYAIIENIEIKFYARGYYRQKVYFNYYIQNKKISKSTILNKKFGIVRVNDTLVLNLLQNDVTKFDVIKIAHKNDFKLYKNSSLNISNKTESIEIFLK